MPTFGSFHLPPSSSSPRGETFDLCRFRGNESQRTYHRVVITRRRLPPVTCPSKVKGRAGRWQWRWPKPRGVRRGRKGIQAECEACGGRRNPTGCHWALRTPAVWVVKEDRPRCLGLHILVEGAGPLCWAGGAELLL